jgi:FkbM family methyltransferase
MSIQSSAKNLLRGTGILEHAAGIKARRISFSQFGEDIHLLSYYDRLAFEKKVVVDHGLIVDIGSFRPISFSNSYAFYKRGWSSINVDPTPGSREIFEKTRPKDRNLQVAVDQTNGTRHFYVFGMPSVWNTMDPDAAARASAATGTTPRMIEVEVSRLDHILDRYSEGRPLEMLLIDTEGLDIQILASNDFDQYRPRVILIEVSGVTLRDIPGHPVFQYLTERDYSLFSWINPNLMFIRNDSMISG